MPNPMELRNLYDQARKSGLKAQDAARSRRQYAHVPNLDGVRERCGMLATVRQGVREVPLDYVVGTNSATRALAFGPNFMPLHGVDTEFGQKWLSLCNAHLEEGLRDPVKVYEYLWRYYCIEGNKRISVLKFYNVWSFRCEITRIIPQRNEDDPDVMRYYAFLSYIKTGLFKNIELSAPWKYKRLRRIEKKLAAELPEGGEQPDYDRMYNDFLYAYSRVNCAALPGDAFIEYLHLYGFPINDTAAAVTERLHTLRPQLELLTTPDAQPEVVLDAEEGEEGMPSILTRLFQKRKTPHIVFAYETGREASPWLQSHDRGRLAVEREFAGRVTTAAADGFTPENTYEKLTALSQGPDLLFITDPTLMDGALRYSLEHPDCLTLAYSPLQHRHLMPTYFGRYYEAVFLCGVAAGLATRSRKVGYITPALSSKRFTSDINAFAIGVRTVCADAQILLDNSPAPCDQVSARAAARKLAAMGVDVTLAQPYLTPHPIDLPPECLTYVTQLDEKGTPIRYVASPRWNWNRFYCSLVQSYLNGSLEELRNLYKGEPSLTSFWWGMGSGVVNAHSASFPIPAGNLFRYLKGSIRRNHYNPFHGPVYDIEGTLRVPEHQDPDALDIMGMDWLVEGVTVV